jgi:hypothetical protein
VNPTPDDLERLLRTARPAPRPAFVRELERSLVPPRAERRRVRVRVVLAASGFAAGLATLAILLSVTGLLPLSSGGGRPAQAAPTCYTVLVERRVRMPYIVRDRHGELTVRYHMRMVPRPVRRCR